MWSSVLFLGSPAVPAEALAGIKSVVSGAAPLAGGDVEPLLAKNVSYFYTPKVSFSLNSVAVKNI